ncbi:MAG TPA: methyltransferase domain-containing protein [Anaeromyxobacter sp.]|jgi:SAM-dependent methyltransferase|nr:methyltransferase domain-containing protein [Anaeromyxobacter sp.]
MTDDYVHGYSDREGARLLDQASTLAELLHGDTRYPAGSSVLEAGCGVGAQTVILARNSPGAQFTSIDLSAGSLEQARLHAVDADIHNVTFQQADLFDLPFRHESFDHVFVCFVLEHLADPGRALQMLRSRLKPGGTLTVIEGDHGSTLFHPEGTKARRAIQCLVELQARAGGDALIGRKLFPLLRSAGFCAITVSPRMVYVDTSRPGWVDEFTKGTFTAMLEGVRERALALGLIEPQVWDEGVAELRRAAGPDGVFCYTFFKAVGVRPAPARSAA